jgi:PadR family transcriptional regulator PadR
VYYSPEGRSGSGVAPTLGWTKALCKNEITMRVVRRQEAPCRIGARKFRGFDPLTLSCSSSVLSIISIKVVTFPQRGSIICLQALVGRRQENMPRRPSPLQSEMVQGTLDMLILRTLVLGPAHGQTVAHAIERGSDEVLQVEHGSLYPALHRLQNRGWVASFWGTSDNNRRAKYYRLTPEGKRQLVTQASRWEQLVRAIGRILNPVPERQP